MARNRMIKPEFWSSATLARVSRDARLCFIGLWSFADDYGYTLFSPRRILGDVYPLDEAVTEAMLVGWVAELRSAGLISVGTLDGKKILRINSWNEHQKVDRPSTRTWVPADKIEEFEASIDGLATDSRNPRESLAQHSRPKEKGKGKGKDMCMSPDFSGEVEEIYAMYPARDPNNGNRCTSKGAKSKELILRSLKAGKPVRRAVQHYLRECRRTGEYLKNFDTLLRNLPDPVTESAPADPGLVDLNLDDYIQEDARACFPKPN